MLLRSGDTHRCGVSFHITRINLFGHISCTKNLNEPILSCHPPISFSLICNNSKNVLPPTYFDIMGSLLWKFLALPINAPISYRVGVSSKYKKRNKLFNGSHKWTSAFIKFLCASTYKRICMYSKHSNTTHFLWFVRFLNHVLKSFGTLSNIMNRGDWSFFGLLSPFSYKLISSL